MARTRKTKTPPTLDTSVLSALSTRHFSWDGKKRVFTAEASELPWHRRENWTVPGGIAPTFLLQSERTGKELRVYRSHVEKTPEGEVSWEEYLPYEKKHRNLFLVVIFND